MQPKPKLPATTPNHMLRHTRDWQSLLYMLALPALVAWQWRYGMHWWLYLPMLFLTLGISVVHHNHAHLKMWQSRWPNRTTDMWLTLLQGHPGFVFYATHNANHHRYHHGPQDAARTYRFGGDHNHLTGYLLHPLHATWALYPLFGRWLGRLRRHAPGAFGYCLVQYLLVAVLWGSLALLDWQKWLLLVLLPQLHGLHWLLATNYLQHAHANGNSKIDFARNFEGTLNPLLFNIGLHTAHHHHGRAHWSTLPTLHAQYRQRVHPRLNRGGLLPYMFTTFFLGLLLARYQSQPLMRPTETS